VQPAARAVTQDPFSWSEGLVSGGSPSLTYHTPRTEPFPADMRGSPHWAMAWPHAASSCQVGCS
jgi:hypothetical protein